MIFNISNKHLVELYSKAALAFLVKILAAFASLTLNIVLARLMSTDDTGRFYSAFTLIIVISTFSRVGLDNVVTKNVAANIALDRPAVAKSYFWCAWRVTLIVSVMTSLCIAISSLLGTLYFFQDIKANEVMTLMTPGIIMVSLMSLYAQGLQGLKKAPQSLATLSIFLPAFASIGALVIVPYYGINGAIAGYLIAGFASVLLGHWFWKKYSPKKSNGGNQISLIAIVRQSAPLFLVSVAQMINSWFGVLLLGVLSTAENVAIFASTLRTAMLTSFVLIAVNSIAAPKFSELHSKNNIVDLRKTAKHACQLVFVFSVPVLLIFIVIPEKVLGIFGDQFKDGAVALVILSIGQFINAATGSVGYILMMTGHERFVRNNMLLAAAINVALSIMLIKPLGVVGVAIGTCIAISVQNILALISVRRTLGVWNLPFLG